MHPVPVHEPRTDAFLRHYVDITAPGAEPLVMERLREVGMVTLDGLATRGAVHSFADRIMAVIPHRDSDSDGLTTIRDTGRRHAGRAGFAGFGNGELAPHTERSGVPSPPRLMLLVCAQAALAGGECLLTDGRAVHSDLALGGSPAGRKAGAVLAMPRTAFFGAGDGHATQVFTVHRDRRVSVRLRLDGLARWSPLLEPHLALLREAVVRHQIRMDLAPGQGYLIDNARWLHARSAFTGERLCWRALGHPHSELPRGFAPVHGPIPPPAYAKAEAG
jgi:hypothetical protein